MYISTPISLCNKAWISIFPALLIYILILAPCALAQKSHEVFFKGTDYELDIYKSMGKTPGKTILLIGGIQGDEPGGFLSADLYADMSLETGNLIVVPRANFLSILLNKREINEDMNRKFSVDEGINFEKKIVAILKQLILEADCVVNLHDGSGFYSDKWESPDRNPQKFGQSVIADCETYHNDQTGKTIELGKIARFVVDKINGTLEKSEHRFTFANHRTADPDTPHPEQRKSATYYALYTCGVPAFGVETSKSLPLELKIKHHNQAINAFMEYFGIIPENPGIYLDPPILSYLVLSINKENPMVVENLRTLHVRKGDTINISHIESNYERGLSVDILNHGAVNDLRKDIVIQTSTQAMVRKDSYPCGKINIVANGNEDPSAMPPPNPKVHYFILKLNSKEYIVRDNALVKAVKGDTIEIVNIETNLPDSSKVVVNFKGFVGDSRNNSGEDRGFAIRTDKDLLTRYSLDGNGVRYQTIVYLDKIEIGSLIVELVDPLLNYVVLQVNEKEKRCFFSGESLTVTSNDVLKLVDIKTNIDDNEGVFAFVQGADNSSRFECAPGEAFHIPPKPQEGRLSSYKILVQRENAVLGWIVVQPTS
ncbi:MAG: M99 family carboxypeptidase catalytic domain-containing protein [Pseudomonadota bacterium]